MTRTGNYKMLNLFKTPVLSIKGKLTLYKINVFNKVFEFQKICVVSESLRSERLYKSQLESSRVWSTIH